MVWRLLAAGEPRLQRRRRSTARSPGWRPAPPRAAVLGIYAGQDARVNETRDAARRARSRPGYRDPDLHRGRPRVLQRHRRALQPGRRGEAWRRVLGWFDRYVDRDHDHDHDSTRRASALDRVAQVGDGRPASGAAVRHAWTGMSRSTTFEGYAIVAPRFGARDAREVGARALRARRRRGRAREPPGPQLPRDRARRPPLRAQDRQHGLRRAELECQNAAMHSSRARRPGSRARPRAGA